MWRKGNPFALLVGIQIGAATVENSMEIPQKIKNGSAFWPSNPTSENISQGIQIWKNISTPLFIEALFTITKIWKQPKCPSVDKWIKQLWGIYTMEFYSTVKKEDNFTLCNSIDGPGEHYAKWNESVIRKTNAIWFQSYVESNEQTERTSKIETDS